MSPETAGSEGPIEWALWLPCLRAAPLQELLHRLREHLERLRADEEAAEPALLVEDQGRGAAVVGEVADQVLGRRAGVGEEDVLGRQGVLGGVAVDRLPGLVAHREDDHAAVAVGAGQAVEVGHLLAARRAPGGPEVEHHDLAAVVGQSAPGAVGEELEPDARDPGLDHLVDPVLEGEGGGRDDGDQEADDHPGPAPEAARPPAAAQAGDPDGHTEDGEDDQRQEDSAVLDDGGEDGLEGSLEGRHGGAPSLSRRPWSPTILDSGAAATSRAQLP